MAAKPHPSPAKPKKRQPAPPDPYLISVTRAAQIAGMDRKLFTRHWDPDAGGWRFHLTDGTSLIVPGLKVGTATRVPRIPLEQALATMKAS